MNKRTLIEFCAVFTAYVFLLIIIVSIKGAGY